MKIENLNNWLSLLANFGVLAGIIFLAIEIQQNTEISQFEALQANRNARIEHFTGVRDSEFIIPILAKQGAGEELTNEEVGRAVNHFRAAWSLEYYDWAQREMGLAGEFSTNQVSAVVASLLTNPIGLRVYNSSKSIYPEGFTNYIDSVIVEINSSAPQ